MRKKIYGIAAAVCLSSVLAAGCGGKNQAETLPAQGGEPVAVSEESSDSEAKNDSNTDADNGAENSEVAAADFSAGSKLKMFSSAWTPSASRISALE